MKPSSHEQKTALQWATDTPALSGGGFAPSLLLRNRKSADNRRKTIALLSAGGSGGSGVEGGAPAEGDGNNGI